MVASHRRTRSAEVTAAERLLLAPFPGPMPRVPHSTDDLEAAELELQHALLHGDAGALEALIDDEATISWTDGTTPGKAAHVEAFRAGRLRMVRFDVHRLRARVLQELGLTVLSAEAEWQRDGHHFTDRVRITRTWQLTDEWRVVASHAGLADRLER